MTDSFLHNHQSALDSQREDDAIRDLEDAGIYPDPRDYPDNQTILFNAFESTFVKYANFKKEDYCD